ncbi:hypothetical protein E2C01_051206 [Portunus trituberculatus]|uniref:Uncharacterized protein n=1 Tax=Portunus trituberculatus TaxID=210409 RepID=A0A5B7GI35_PORTR|nr:hypothetical protein [Portunus trituberculatus]
MVQRSGVQRGPVQRGWGRCGGRARRVRPLIGGRIGRPALLKAQDQCGRGGLAGAGGSPSLRHSSPGEQQQLPSSPPPPPLSAIPAVPLCRREVCVSRRDSLSATVVQHPEACVWQPGVCVGDRGLWREAQGVQEACKVAGRGLAPRHAAVEAVPRRCRRQQGNKGSKGAPRHGPPRRTPLGWCRPPPPPAQHPMVGQQGPAGYLGYYPAQPAHHYQYPPPDFNCNLQPFVPTQFSDGLQGGPPAWHNPVYMGGHHHPAAHHAAAAHHHAVQHCQQRSPATYDDWMTPLHHNGGGASPLPQHPSLGSVGTGVHQPPHTPSPCAPGAAGPQAAPPSPTFNSYSKLPGVGGQLEYGSDGGVSGAQSPNEGVLGLAESAGDDESPPATHPQPPNAHPTPPTTLPTSTTHPPPTTHPPSSRPQQIRSPFRWIEKTAFQGPPHSGEPCSALCVRPATHLAPHITPHTTHHTPHTTVSASAAKAITAAATTTLADPFLSLRYR